MNKLFKFICQSFKVIVIKLKVINFYGFYYYLQTQYNSTSTRGCRFEMIEIAVNVDSLCMNLGLFVKVSIIIQCGIC